MFWVRPSSIFLSWLCLIGIIILPTTSTSAFIPTAKPGCPTKCGNLTVPYPFGIGLDGSCSQSHWHNINCDNSFDPPRPFLGKGRLQVMGISETQIRLENYVASQCYKDGQVNSSDNVAVLDLSDYPFIFSDTANRFTVIGCDDLALIKGGLGVNFKTGCIAKCSKKEDVINGSCTGIGCCQTLIPKGLKMFAAAVVSGTNHTNVSDFDPCSYTFLGDYERFKFNVADLSDPEFVNRTTKNVPIVIEWVVGGDETCKQARKKASSYACQQNTTCTDFNTGSGGYRCSCLPGYQGNPYLSPRPMS